MRLLLLSCLLIVSASGLAQAGFKNPVFNVDLEPISNIESKTRVYPDRIEDLTHPNQAKTECEVLEDTVSHISLKCIYTQKNNLGKTDVFTLYEKFISAGPSWYDCPCKIKHLFCQTLQDLQTETCSRGYLCASNTTDCGKTEPRD